MKKFLTIMLAIVMIAMMFVMVSCGKTVENNKENGSINNNSVITNDNNNKTEESVDNYYFPDTENLIGIAVYRVREGEEYPYREGQKLTNFDDWKFFYVDSMQDGENVNVVFDDNIINRSVNYVDGNISVQCNYKTNDMAYFGYIYRENTSLYLLATQDQAQDETSQWSVDGLGFISLRISKLYQEEPTHYRYVFQIDDVMNDKGYYVGRTVYSSEIHSVDTLPTEITFDNEPWVNFVAIEMISKTGEVLGTRKIEYYEDAPYVGKPGITKMLDLFKDGESYQHVVTINKEK